MKMLCENVVNIAFLVIFLFNIQQTKILKRLNCIFNVLKFLFRVVTIFFFFFLGWSMTHINLKLNFLKIYLKIIIQIRVVT